MERRLHKRAWGPTGQREVGVHQVWRLLRSQINQPLVKLLLMEKWWKFQTKTAIQLTNQLRQPQVD
jgi:hypothetical protein